MKGGERLKIKVDINTAKILQQKGLGGDHRAQRYLASEVKRFCAPYVPMNTGTLQNSAEISEDGSKLTYVQPYAHYQYHGQVMGPNYQDENGDWHSGKAPKHYTGEALTYSGGSMRGPNWDKRMVIDRGDDLAKSLEEYIKKQG